MKRRRDLSRSSETSHGISEGPALVPCRWKTSSTGKAGVVQRDTGGSGLDRLRRAVDRERRRQSADGDGASEVGPERSGANREHPLATSGPADRSGSSAVEAPRLAGARRGFARVKCVGSITEHGCSSLKCGLQKIGRTCLGCSKRWTERLLPEWPSPTGAEAPSMGRRGASRAKRRAEPST